MGRIHSPRNGKSHSTRPNNKEKPDWIDYSPDQIISLIVKLAKEENTASQIGIKLRDEHGIPLVKTIIGKSITQVLKENDLSPETPEDLNRLLIRSSKLQSHLKSHPGDRRNIRSLELLEAKIHRLSKYYKKEEILPKDWKFSVAVAQLE